MSKMREKEPEKDRLSLIPEPLSLSLQRPTSFYAKSMNLEKTRRNTGEKRRDLRKIGFNGRRWKDVRVNAGKALWGKGFGGVEAGVGQKPI